MTSFRYLLLMSELCYEGRRPELEHINANGQPIPFNVCCGYKVQTREHRSGTTINKMDTIY